ncbi:MAG: type II toxin-antitoxin system HicA family toxin [Rhodoglobus sp.]
MVSEQPTRIVVKLLRSAGWQPVRTEGSHTVWRAPTGRTVSVTDGHRTISPGVYRSIVKAIEEEKR